MGIEQDRIIASTAGRDDEVVDRAVRPKVLADYVGQVNVKTQMEIFIQAARNRGEALDHVLIFGPPGLGKTTLAHIIANELQVNLRQTSGPVLERPGDLAALLTNLEPRDVLFVDEIHRLSPVVEEVLYPAMEDSQLDLMIGEGPGARSIKLDLPPFTLVGATTRAGLLTSPLRDRFGIVQRLDFYSTEELTKIVVRSASILKLRLQADGADRIAERARGTPRIANRLLRRVRDFAEVKAAGIISGEVAVAALDMLEVDPQGFDMLDRKLLLTVIEKFEGGPVGVDSLAAAMSEERDTIEDVIEPFLIQQGFLMRTARGRIATRKVLCAVAGCTPRLLQMVALRSPIVIHPLQAMVSEPLKPWLDPIIVSASLHVYVSQSARGELVMGASLDPYELHSTRSTLDFTELLAAHMLELFPFLSDVKINRQWAGMADMTPDFAPIMGLTPVQGFYLDSGWGTWGFKATPVCGKTMSHTVATGRNHPLIEGFTFDRFARYQLTGEKGAASVGH